MERSNQVILSLFFIFLGWALTYHFTIGQGQCDWKKGHFEFSREIPCMTLYSSNGETQKFCDPKYLKEYQEEYK